MSLENIFFHQRTTNNEQRTTNNEQRATKKDIKKGNLSCTH